MQLSPHLVLYCFCCANLWTIYPAYPWDGWTMERCRVAESTLTVPVVFSDAGGGEEAPAMLYLVVKPSIV